MKLLLDEMLSPDIAEQLRERGHDVQAVAASEHAELDGPRRPRHRALGRIVAALEAKLQTYPGLEDLAHAEEWL